VSLNNSYDLFALALLSVWLIPNLVGLLSVILSFTWLRNSGVVFATAIVSLCFGIYLTISMGIPNNSVPPVYWMSWSCLIWGTIGLLRWHTARPIIRSQST
jgi:hypothetical protein